MTVIPNSRAVFCPRLLAFCALPLACAQAPAPPAQVHQTPEDVTSQLITQLVERGEEVGFSYLVVSAAGPTFALTRGRLDAAGTAQVDAQTLFLSASTTKIVTALAVLRLVDQGKLQLDDAFTRYLPELPYAQDVTVRRLLSHSAGIPNPLPLKWLHSRAVHPHFSESSALLEVVKSSAGDVARAGEKYRYSNLGYWLLGALIERVSGQKYATFVREQLLTPLGIDDQDFSFEPLEGKLARGHYERYSLFGLALPLLTDHTHRTSGVGRWGRFETLFMNGPAYGGGFATARGYGRLLGALLDDSATLLSADSRAVLFSTQQDNTGKPLGVSLAFRRGRLGQENYFSKPGGGPGFSGNVRVYKRLGIATVFLSNRMRFSENAIEELSDQLDAAFVAERAQSLTSTRRQP